MKQFAKDDIAQNTKIYDLYRDEFSWIDGWPKTDQLNNFRLMAKIQNLTRVPLKGSSCLDVGCGTGEMSSYLHKKRIRKYVGIDIYERSIIEAREKYPEEEFIVGDIIQGIIDEKFDYIFASGALSIKLKTGNYDFLESMVKAMWKQTNVGLVFNFLTSDDPEWDHNLFFYDLNRVIDICQTIDYDAILYTHKDNKLYQAHVYMLKISTP